VVRWVVVMNKFTLKCILSVKIPNFPLFGGCNLFFLIQDFGHSGN